MEVGEGIGMALNMEHLKETERQIKIPEWHLTPCGCFSWSGFRNPLTVGLFAI